MGSVKQSKTGYVQERKSINCCLKCCIITTIIIFILLLLIFLIVFIGLPVVFRLSPEIQRKFVFKTDPANTRRYNYNNFSEYHVDGYRNFYHGINGKENIILGVWHVLPKALQNMSLQDKFNYESSLKYSGYPVLMFFHGQAGIRFEKIKMYEVLRTFFHVIAFDYRGYGDSTPVAPTEEGIVQDSIELYKWLRSSTNANIYVWGHSLGAAISVHTVARLRYENIVPMGLFLEAPFDTLEDTVNTMTVAKVVSWLPWYKPLILDALKENGFSFESTKNILKVDCPIMIVHAEDDEKVPIALGQHLFRVARENRDPSTQGNVTFHFLPKTLHCGHMLIYTAPDLPKFIRLSCL